MILAYAFLSIAWLAGFLLLGKIKNLQKIPSFNRHIPTITMVIPARNEAQNLTRLLGSLVEQKINPYQIIVVDDHSSDDTAKIANSFGALCIESKPLPNGWTGKNWACFQGAEAAIGEVLFFIDADVFFSKNGYDTIVEQYSKLKAERPLALSILPFHKIQRPYENLSLFFNLVMAAGAGKFGWLGESVLFGQSLLVEKRDYFFVGGHESVKGQVLENVFMSKNFRRCDLDIQTYSGESVLSFQMFSQNLTQLIEGWTKAFATGATQTPISRLITSILWLFGFPSVLLAVFIPSFWGAPHLIALGGFYIAFALQLYWFSKRLGSFRFWPSLLYPFSWIFYQAIFFRSLLIRKKQKTWRGRTLP